MMTTLFKYNSLFLTLFILCYSCTDVVSVDVPNGGARLVVEASINWEKGTSGQEQTIKLSQSTAFFDTDPNIPVTGALVTVTKVNDGMQFNFEDQNNGDYIATDFVPEVNQNYTLEILYNGNTYTASETLTSMTEINSIVQTLEGDGDEAEIQIKVFFDDPENTENFYSGEFSSSVNPLVTLATLSDQFTDGNANFLEFDNESLVPGTQVDVRVFGISKAYYNYLDVLVAQSIETDGPFQTTPVQLKGNCINPNNPDEEVLGYFRLSEVATASYIIE